MTEALTDIPETLIIPPNCIENHFPLSGSAAKPLLGRDIKGAGLSRLYKPYEVKRTWPASHLIMYTVEGSAIITDGVATQRLGPGEVWVSSAGIPQRYWTEDYWHCYWFHLFDTPYWQSLAGRPMSVSQARNLPQMLTAVENYIGESVSNLRDSQKLAEAYAEVIGVYLERDVILHGSLQEDETRHMLASLWEKVNSDLRHAWTVENMADCIGISRAGLHRATLRYQGQTPMEFVTELRMRRAEQLLKGTFYTLEQVAALVGYSTPFSLSRAFKRYSGQCPREFRNR